MPSRLKSLLFSSMQLRGITLKNPVAEKRHVGAVSNTVHI
jgi:hypothetical protein